jgi:hypothetical protein
MKVYQKYAIFMLKYLAMKKYKNLIPILFIFVTTTSLVFYANTIYKNSIEYEKIANLIANKDMLDSKLSDKPENILGKILGAFMGQKTGIDKSDNILKEKKNYYKKKIITGLIIFSSILIISLLGYFFLSKIIFLLYLNILSLISLLFGLITPIFSFLVQHDLPVIGYAVLEFESNTLISSIMKLFTQDNYFVAGIIFVFSIIFPLLKIFIVSVALFVKNNILLKVINISSLLSKWSMIDVYVLSIFLVYLSSSKSDTIVSEIQAGFYMFFSYVVLSLISSSMYTLKIKQDYENNNI